MAGRLLLFILMCSVHEIQPQALRRPKLTVNPSVITQKDVVTLNCEAPSSVPVSQCYFNTLREESPKNLPCLTTLKATELLEMFHQSSTSVVEVICYYLAKFGENKYASPYSDTTSITIHILHPPKLTVDPAVITETDSVTLNCQTPSSVSVSQCFIYAGRQENIIGFSCLRTLKGADLLSMTRQSSPAVIEVKCYYSVKLEELNSPSPHSETSSIIIHNSISEMKTQALLPPKLTVNPSMITETDTVTLNCQTPSSVSVHQCYFHIGGEPARSFPCLKTLRGTELLEMTRQSPPAEVKVTCFYVVMFESPESHASFIIIQTSLAPKLTVNPPAIKETDAVILKCQTPSSVSVSQCYFYTVSGGYVPGSSCLRTLSGTELLKVSQQSSPAVVELICYYTVNSEESPRSDIFSITINSPKPKMSVQHFHGDRVLFTCSLPESVHHETTCNLYFGEADHPVMTANIWSKTNTEVEASFCLFRVSIADLLSHLSSVEQSDASCDYSLGSKLNPLSPRSDGYSLTDIVEKESQTTPAIQTLSVTTGVTVSGPRVSSPLTPVKARPVSTPSVTDGVISTSPTSLNPATDLTVSTINSLSPRSDGNSLTDIVEKESQTRPAIQTLSVTTGSSVWTPGTMDGTNPPKTASRRNNKWIWTSVIVVVGCGVTVGVIFLVSAVLRYKKRAGSEEANERKPQTENSDIYHLYDVIPEEPTASALMDVTYSTVQKH